MIHTFVDHYQRLSLFVSVCACLNSMSYGVPQLGSVCVLCRVVVLLASSIFTKFKSANFRPPLCYYSLLCCAWCDGNSQPRPVLIRFDHSNTLNPFSYARLARTDSQSPTRKANESRSFFLITHTNTHTHSPFRIVCHQLKQSALTLPIWFDGR